MRYFLVAFIGLLLVSSSMYGQTDTLLLESLKRTSASTPFSFGLVLGLNSALVRLDEQVSPINEVQLPDVYNITLYADVWQVGFITRPYGNVISIGNRSSPSREVCGSLSVEFGSYTQTEKLSVHSSGSLDYRPLKDREVSVFAISGNALFWATSRYGDQFLFEEIELTAGTATTDDDQNTFVLLNLSVGYRFPVFAGGLAFGVSGFGGIWPVRDVIRSDTDYAKEDIIRNSGMLGFSLFVRAGIGLDLL